MPSILNEALEWLAVWLRNARGGNHQLLSWSCVANSLLRAAVGTAAARASRSKLSASSKTAFLAPGSFNCPATSRACSARSSHSKASFKFDGIWSSLSGFVSLRLSLPKLRLPHQGHTAATAEAASHTAPQRPTDRSSATTSPNPGASLEIASRAAASG